MLSNSIAQYKCDENQEKVVNACLSNMEGGVVKPFTESLRLSPFCSIHGRLTLMENLKMQELRQILAAATRVQHRSLCG